MACQIVCLYRREFELSIGTVVAESVARKSCDRRRDCLEQPRPLFMRFVARVTGITGKVRRVFNPSRTTKGRHHARRQPLRLSDSIRNYFLRRLHPASPINPKPAPNSVTVVGSGMV